MTETSAAEAGEKPPPVDLSPRLLRVRDQGQRGTCLMFATTAAHEHARWNRRGAPSAELSVEVLFWRAKQLDGAPRLDGTSFLACRDALQDTGQSDETFWPYDGTRDHTASGYEPPPEAIETDRLRRATLRPIAGSADSIRDALRDRHVVIAGLELWDGFYDCESAELTAPDGDLDGAGHAVCLVGFDDNRHLVKVRNSWGPDWGENGYAWLTIDALSEVLIEAWIAIDDVDDD